MSRKTRFIGDMHLGHPGVIMHCERPVLQKEDVIREPGKGPVWVSDEIKELRTKEQDEMTIDIFNSTVKSGDTTFFVGDMCWKDHERYIQALNGKKILIKGNHDKMSQTAYGMFSEVKEIYDFKKDHTLAVVCHFPMYSWTRSVHGSWHIHAHTHNSPFVHPGLAMNVGLDLSPKWAPFEWEEDIVPWFVAREQELERIRDHHGVQPEQQVKDLLGDILDEFRKPEIQLQRDRIQEMYNLLKGY